MLERIGALLVVLAGLAAMAPPAPALAHPHGWIDVQTKLLVDAEGRFTTLEQAWLFDELYSAFMLEDFASLGQTMEEGLAELAAADLAALHEYDYFTRVEVDGAPVAFDRVVAYANGVVDGRIWLKFALPLTEAVAVRDHELRYSVHDPSYYVEMMHIGGPPLVEAEDADLGCEVELVEPKPPAGMAGLAASLDQGAIGPADLGGYFAQWVHVACA